MTEQQEKQTDRRKLAKEWFVQRFHRNWNDANWEQVSFTEDLEEKEKIDIGVALWTEEVVSRSDVAEHCENLIQHLKNREETAFEPLEPMKEQFAIKYQGKVAKSLLMRVESCYKNWTSSNSYYAPYISLVQSSGYGKSRACKEIALDPSWLTVFICCRPKHWRGYPPQTDAVMSFFDKVISESYYLKAIDKMKLWLEWLLYCRRVFRLIYSHTSDVQTIVDTLTEKNLNVKFATDGSIDSDNEKAERHAFWSFCVEPDEKASTALQELFAFIERKVKNKELPQKLDDDRRVLIIIDEARYFVKCKLRGSKEFSLFRIFRSSIKQFNKGLFAIVVDTVSYLANFSPSSRDDRSLRMSVRDDEEEQCDLFHPFTAVATTDQLCDRQGDFDDPKYRFTLGRPLWQASCQTSDVQVDELLKFAQRKLFGGASIPNDNGKIACIAVLTGMCISPVSTTAKELVASHMATCLAVDAKRESLFAYYPLEPVLAEAAKCYIQACKQSGSLSEVFQPLLHCFRIGALDRGYGGELVVKILLLLGQFEVSKRESLFSSCQEMLNALLGDFLTQQNFFCATDQFSFNCFAELSGNLKYWSTSNPQEELKMFFNRGAAIQLPKLHRGADLLLPIRRKIAADKYEFKYLLFQVKNHQRALVPSQILTYKIVMPNAFESSLWTDCDIGFSVIMNVGQKAEESSWCWGKTGNKKKPHQQFFVVKGLGCNSYKVLGNEGKTVSALKRMLREPAILDWVTGDTPTKEDIIQFCPVTHRSWFRRSN